tara:strand:+ start:67 stop:678 length:612 start_codon:yes stop_codon:yes gene_type:complete
VANYQDYVIKDGRFVGKFEEMYKLFDEPWHQCDEGYFNDLSRKVVLHYIEKYNICSCVEFGCGLGQTTNFIKLNSNIDILGIDISKTSISKAKKSFPSLTFIADDVDNISNYSEYDCFFFSEITWYLLEDNFLDKLFYKMQNELKGKYFIHNLVFYKKAQEYGRNYFTNLREFIDFCPFKLISSTEINESNNDVIKSSTIFQI